MQMTFHFRTDRLRILLLAFLMCCVPSFPDTVAGSESPPPGLPSSDWSDGGERDFEGSDEFNAFQHDALPPDRMSSEPVAHGVAAGGENPAQKVLETTGYYSTTRPPPPPR